LARGKTAPTTRAVRITGFLCGLTLAACAAAGDSVPPVVQVPAGPFVAGSDAAEREAAYRLDERAYGHGATREQRWYDAERARGPAATGAFAITVTPITNRQYAAFVAATGHLAPDVDRATWEGFGLVHPYASTRRFAWTGNRPPAGRDDHPVVLVSVADAQAYAGWLSRRTGRAWRLPTELEWEKAARGTDGRVFPWGNAFDPARLNSHDAGPFDTVPAGRFPAGASPFGVLDAAGQVYEWTATTAGAGRAIVKGGSWDDKGCGVCRSAARHARPVTLKHILIGFRLVRDPGR
jgi:formylglycine-generating enzyme required for sulfatase activity